MNPMKSQILQRLGANAPGQHVRAVEDVFGLSAVFAEKVEKIRGDDLLSPVGKSNAIRTLLNGGIGDHFRQVKGMSSKHRKEIADERAALAPKEPDRADVFAEMQRAELRAHLRTMTEPNLMHLARNDETAATALIFSPAALGLVNEKQRAELIAELTEKKFGPKIAELNKRAGQIADVENAIAIASIDMKRVGGLNDQEFADLTQVNS